MGWGSVNWVLLRWGGVWWWRCRGWVVYPVGSGREWGRRKGLTLLTEPFNNKPVWVYLWAGENIGPKSCVLFMD